ncbi:MAG TPA: hypothetical protein VF703_02845 [Pyrinomonadaceae bacterium]|jgi:hypothetical protein
MTAFAFFPADLHVHLLKNAYRTRTLCDLSTKGGRRGVRERRPPAVVTLSAPTPNHTLCPLCLAQAGRES